MSAPHPVTPVLDDIPVATVPTPNPDALMFRVEEMLVPSGTYEFKSEAAAAGSPLARRLFGVPGIEMVLVAPRFATVGKLPDSEWPAIVPLVKQAIREFLVSGDLAVEGDGAPVARDLSDTERRIAEMIESEVKPAIAMDGGDVEFVAFEDGIVKLRMYGACGTCPSSLTTLKMGIENLLLEEFPGEVRAVEQV